MLELTEITDEYKQFLNVTVPGGDNQTFDLTLEFVEQQQRWIYSVNFGDFILNGPRLVVSPNMLRQYRVLPFGLGVIASDTSDTQDPYRLDDFRKGRIKVMVLSEEEVDEVEANLYA